MNFVKQNQSCLISKCVRLFSFFIVGITFVSLVDGKEKMDIRPYEAADLCSSNIPQVRVTVKGVNNGGILSVELYHDPENFLNKKGRTKRIRIPATEEQHVVCFNLDKQGIYAVATYHDVDGNRKLNKKWNMRPAEPFGLSNNPKLRLGFPKFDDAAFTTGELGADIVINLQNP
ncbi:MAG: DUF2141 domain-containing protein [Nitrosomonas sp.]|nr:DUF2141 domain-containing protein [Nitrosomonas sp.]MCW5608885.1 DUF2141 domain-containing protein [Nitrosomonas sp.]